MEVSFLSCPMSSSVYQPQFIRNLIENTVEHPYEAVASHCILGSPFHRKLFFAFRFWDTSFKSFNQIQFIVPMT